MAAQLSLYRGPKAAGSSLTAGILVGGGSRRFGRDKAFAVWKDRTLLSWTIEKARVLTDRVYLLAKDSRKYHEYNLPVLTDHSEVPTPINGVLTIAPRVEEWLLLLACDIPFYSPGILEHLWDRREPGKAVVVKVGEKYQPFMALYHVDTLAYWQRAFNRGDYHLQRVIEGMPRVVVRDQELRPLDKDLLTFANFNTPEELAAFG